ncbi:MAG: aminofutalosine synthase MqnE, partial [Armatimonadota bacterium]
VQAFTAVEMAHIAKVGGLSIRETLLELKEAGLGSLPGGGAEVFSPRVRAELCPEKIPADEWLSITRTAHEVGLRSNATMLYAHVERPEERVEHLLRLRELQDETGGFMAFIPLAYHGDGPRSSAIDDLRMVAASRLILDNFDHIKTFWIMVGLKLAQVALHFGADDFDGTVVEEKITHSAGAATPEGLTAADIRRLIEQAGMRPVERDTLYKEVVR